MAIDTIQLKYEERITSYADILGFSERVSGSNDGELGDIVQMIADFRDAFDVPVDGDEGGEGIIKKVHENDIVVPFSDGFMRGRGNDYAPLFYEILGFVHGTANLLMKGYLVRGSITHGNVYYDRGSNILVSPAFIRAYRLEQEAAIYPRVIIDPQTLAAFPSKKGWRKDGHTFEDEARYVYDCLRLDSDGYYYVDYLKAIYGELDTPDEYPDVISRHRDVVMSSLEAANSDAVMRKIVWLGNYHNAVISEYQDSDALSGLEISADLLKI